MSLLPDFGGLAARLSPEAALSTSSADSSWTVMLSSAWRSSLSEGRRDFDRVGCASRGGMEAASTT